MRKLRTLLGVLALCVASRAGAEAISIADARSLPAGTVVTVEGAVTVPSGAFASSTFDRVSAYRTRRPGSTSPRPRIRTSTSSAGCG